MGLISQERYDKYLEKQRLIEEERQRVAQVSVPLTDTIQQILTAKGTAPLKTGCKLEELLRRPQLTYADLAPVDPKRPDLPAAVFEQVEIGIKYAGYIARQEQQIKELRRVEAQRIPADIDYSKLTGLRLEAKESWLPFALKTWGRLPGSAGSTRRMWQRCTFYWRAYDRHGEIISTA